MGCQALTLADGSFALGDFYRMLDILLKLATWDCQLLD